MYITSIYITLIKYFSCCQEEGSLVLHKLIRKYSLSICPKVSALGSMSFLMFVFLLLLSLFVFDFHNKNYIKNNSELAAIHRNLTEVQCRIEDFYKKTEIPSSERPKFMQRQEKKCLSKVKQISGVITKQKRCVLLNILNV